MSEIIRSVAGEFSAEKVIEKSRFLSYCAHVTSEEEARAFVETIRKKHSDATHNCFGFVADKIGSLQRFSDDGEPQGTAGMPILEVIKNKNLFETAVVVTRYFGGIKLGAGGLVRAYSSAAADVLDVAKICIWQTCGELTVEVDYPQIDGAMKFFAEHACEVKDTSYAESVRFLLYVKSSQLSAFQADLVDYLSGKVRLKSGNTFFYPFPEE